MRYLVALGMSCLVAGALLAHHWWVDSMVAAMTEQARVKAGLPPDAYRAEIGIPLTGRQMLHVELDHVLWRFRFLLIPLFLLIGLGIAGALPRARSTIAPSSSPSDRP